MAGHLDVDDPKGSVAAVSARRRVVTRVVLFVLVAVAAGWAVAWSWPGIRFAMSGGELRRVGDVRALRASGVNTLDAPAGSYARLENLLVTRPAEGTRFNYFWCPIYGVLVRTNQPIPELTGRIVEATVPEGLEYLLQEHVVRDAAVFALHLDAEGWLMPLADVPGFKGAVGDYVRQTLKLTPEQVAESWALLDGESPSGHGRDLWVLAGAVLAFLVSLGGLLVAIRAWRRVAA
jgi:hypothetical protein